MFNKANVWRTYWGRKHLIRCCIGYASLSLSIIIAAWILGAGQNRIYAINLYLSPCKIVHCYISVGGFNDFCVFNFLKFKSRTPIAVLKVRKQGETDILLTRAAKSLAAYSGEIISRFRTFQIALLSVIDHKLSRNEIDLFAKGFLFVPETWKWFVLKPYTVSLCNFTR